MTSLAAIAHALPPWWMPRLIVERLRTRWPPGPRVHRRRVGPAPGASSSLRHRPVDRGACRGDRAGKCARRRCGGGRGAARLRHLVREFRPEQGLASRPRPHPDPRAGRTVRPGDLAGDGRRHRLCAQHTGAGRGGAHPRGPGQSGQLSVPHPSGGRGHHARGHRRVRPDHALELAALPDHRQGRPRPGSGMYGRPEAQRAVAPERLALCRGDARRRHPAGCVQPGERQWAGGRRRAVGASGRGHDLDHRFDPGRRPGGPGGGADGEARGPGTRREIAQRDPAGCGPGACRAGRRGGRLPQRRPILQRSDPHDRAPRAPAGSRTDRARSGIQLRRGRSALAADHARPGGESRPVQSGAGNDRHRHRRRRAAHLWRPRPAGGLEPRLLLPSDHLLRGASSDADRAGGDLRAGTRADPL